MGIIDHPDVLRTERGGAVMAQSNRFAAGSPSGKEGQIGLLPN
jgi:hypothetical protein